MTRREVKEAIAELTLAVEQAGLGTAPLVCAMRRVGEEGEDRPPGLYRENGCQIVVYDREDGPTDEELREYFPRGHTPLLIGGEANPNLL